MVSAAHDVASGPGRSSTPEPAAARHPLTAWLPPGAAVVAVAAILLAADTPPEDLLRYGLYAAFAVALPGTLVFRLLRRTPHTLVEDVAMGVAVGLALELAGWAVFSALDLRGWLWAWPLAVVVPFAAVPALRRHWWVRDYRRVPPGWSWAVSGIAVFFTAYLSAVFLERNPILPDSEQTRQYLDLSYQQSLAAEAAHRFPPDLPQVLGEPLRYHWFAHAHMAISSMIGHIDLPVVTLRLAVPALCVAAVVLTAVVGWRVSGRPYVGVGAAVLFWVIGEVHFTNPLIQPFGTQATFVIWHGMSMIYSWVLLIALIGVAADIVGRAANSAAPVLGRGAYPLAALLMLASSGAKASSLPVLLAGLGVAALAVLVMKRRIPWPIVTAVAIGLTVQVLATAVLFAFQSYGLTIDFFANFSVFWQPQPGDTGRTRAAMVIGVWLAFLISMQLRLGGIVPLIWLKRGRLEPVQWFLLGGAVAGPALFLTFTTSAAQYFTRAGFTFGVLLSAWGFALVLDRARLSPVAKLWLGAAAAVFAGVLTRIQIGYAQPAPPGRPYNQFLPLLTWAAGLVAVGVVLGAAWAVTARRWSALRGRGPAVALTAVLVAGAPGLIMDSYQSIRTPNGGAYFNVSLPKSRVDAARWIRDRSDPDDVVATNVHCLAGSGPACGAFSFWVSAYTERSVLIEGWAFAPRVAGDAPDQFWDLDRYQRNEAAFYVPTAEVLADLRDQHGVRWLLVDRQVGPESPILGELAALRFDNGRMAVYELGRPSGS